MRKYLPPTLENYQQNRELFREEITRRVSEAGGRRIMLSKVDEALFDTVSDALTELRWRVCHLDKVCQGLDEQVGSRLRELDLRLRVVEQGTRPLLATQEGADYRSFMLRKLHEMPVVASPGAPRDQVAVVAGPGEGQQALAKNLEVPE